MPRNRLVILTGISGTGRHHIKTTAKQKLPTWKVLDFEQKYLANRLREFHQRIRPRRDLDEVTEDEYYDLAPLLTLPEPIIRQAWRAAFAEAAIGIQADLSAHDVLVFTHASVLSGESTSAFPIFDAGDLATSGLTADIVINLIDDVYDSLVRLTRHNKLYDNYGYRNILNEVSYLLQLLDWRETEFRASEILASGLASPETILFAVKHPWETLQKLIEGTPQRRVYLSHPITAIRKSGGPIHDNRLFRDISTIASHLRDHYIVFEPTTIDELRLSVAASGSEPMLERWPVPLDKSGSPDPQCLSAPQNAPRLFLEQEHDVATGAVETLRQRIDLQVNWRDRQLVEQANTLAVIRPFAVNEPRISGGVGEEMILHRTMAIIFPDSRSHGVVLHPAGDEVGRKKRLLQLIIADNYTRDGKALPWQSPEIANAASVLMQQCDEGTKARDIDSLIQREMPGVRLGNDHTTYMNLGMHMRIDNPNMERAELADLVKEVLFVEREKVDGLYVTSSHAFLSQKGEFAVLDGGEAYESQQYSIVAQDLILTLGETRDRLTSYAASPV